MRFEPWMKWQIVLWITSELLVASEAFAQQTPRNAAAAPAEMSTAGGRIAYRTIDPLSSSQRENRIRSRLGQPWGSQFHCSDLHQFVVQLNSIVPVYVNERSLDEIGLSTGESVELDISADETPLMTLARALDSLDLTWTLRAGRCVIETIEAAEWSLVVRVYDVTPLVVVDVAEGGHMPIRRRMDFTSLEDLIHTTIRPDTWEALGGPSTFGRFILGQRCLLTIATTTQTHLEIESLLNHLNQLGHPHERSLQRVVVKKSSGLPKFGRSVSSLQR